MRRHIAAGLAVIIGLMTLTGCASAAAPTAGSSSAPVNLTSPVTEGPAPVTGAPASPAPVPSSTVIVNPPGPSPYPDEGVTVIRGPIIAGAEPTCKLLVDDKVEYLLLANDSVQIPVGGAAIVNGYRPHGIMTHCQQGIPFVVTSIRLLPLQQ